MKTKYKLWQNEQGIYYFRFKRNNKDHKRTTKTNNKREAIKKADEYYTKILHTEELSKPAIKKEYEAILSKGNDILLSEAFDIFINQPRKKALSELSKSQKQGYWTDFLAFMATIHPETEKIAHVQETHAKEYIQHIRTKGKFDKIRKYTWQGKQIQGTKPLQSKLSINTCNKYHTALKEIFNKVLSDPQDNPFNFDKFQKEKSTENKRQPFTPEELNKVFSSNNQFVIDIFTIGRNTGLRLGDICTLKKTDINLKNERITRLTRKTKEEVTIPILKEFKEYLIDTISKHPESEYLLPEHAHLYKHNKTEISARVKDLLNKLKIKNVVKVEGGKAISIKDSHSLRHTFVYEASKKKIPLHTIKTIIGHSSIAMTLYYSEHTQLEEAREAMEQMNISCKPEQGE